MVILLPISGSELLQINFSELPVDAVLKMLFVVLFTTCGAYFLNIYAISKLKATTVAFYIYLQPLLATVLAVLLEKDFLTGIKLISAVFIFLGVYFVLKRASR